VVTSSNVVVYGTGWYYPPYVGAYWYGAPYTYGYGVAFSWGVASGWGYAYANNYYSAAGAAWANPYTGNTYNPNTNTGVAVANNNVYADRNGNIYRYNPSTGAQQRTENGWESVQRSQDRSWVQNQHQARSLGEQRSANFGANRPSGGSLRGGGEGGFRGRR
jgi:hypothetical protein